MDKVVCIKEGHKDLTYGKIYDASFAILNEFISGWVLIGDSGWKISFQDKFGWVIPLAEWRNKQIDKILDDD